MAPYANDIALLKGPVAAKRVAALVAYPDAKAAYLATRARPGDANKKLDSCMHIVHPAPILDIPEVDVLVNADTETPLLYFIEP